MVIFVHYFLDLVVGKGFCVLFFEMAFMGTEEWTWLRLGPVLVTAGLEELLLEILNLVVLLVDMEAKRHSVSIGAFIPHALWIGVCMGN